MSKLAIQLVVLNGEKYISDCLRSVVSQTYSHQEIEIHLLDNGSTDGTLAALESFVSQNDFKNVTLTRAPKNLGMWPGHEQLLAKSDAPYVVFLSVDVTLDKDFIKNAVAALDANAKVGALQAKIYQPHSKNIDTCGFEIYRSRRVGNIGHGVEDKGQFDKAQEIFGVEGAVPVFRRQALESIRVAGEITDHDLFWYAEDLDVAWRLRLAGWNQIYDPSVIAWHDRGTTKGHTHGGWGAYIARVHIRRQIPLRRRQLEWRNTRLTRLKNDHFVNIIKDLPYILMRELEVLGYTILFEPAVLRELPNLIRLKFRMLRKRGQILGQAKVSAAHIHSFFK